ncbi:MAG: hypothetical protein IT531_03125 [Burkholderiales bacterium]|nr:hypothetical protein [Burkholderiales bacterium]
MLIAFIVPMLPVLLVVLPLRVVAYAFVGGDNLRSSIKIPGKALDQLVNATYFGGHPKETISSHAGRWLTEAPERAPRWAHVIAWLTNIAEKDHVIKAIEAPFKGLPLG